MRKEGKDLVDQWCTSLFQLVLMWLPTLGLWMWFGCHQTRLPEIWWLLLSFFTVGGAVIVGFEISRKWGDDVYPEIVAGAWAVAVGGALALAVWRTCSILQVEWNPALALLAGIPCAFFSILCWERPNHPDGFSRWWEKVIIFLIYVIEGGLTAWAVAALLM